MTNPEIQTPEFKTAAPIESVHQAAWQLAWSPRYKKTTIWIIVISGIISIPFFNPIPLVVVCGIYFAYLHTKAEKWFFEQFADANNLNYSESAPIESVKGRLFDVGHGKEISNVVSGIHQNHPMRLYHYSYSVGGGKNQRTYNFTVFEITFEKTVFPHILLQSRTMWKYGSEDNSGEVQDIELSLEGEFSKSYRLYSTQKYEIEILQIFTHEVLQFLKQNGPELSIEFAENKMYIYDDRAISNRKQLDAMYNVAQKIFDSIGPLLNRLHDDFAALHEYYGNKS